jgi:hypothetical protein
MDSAGSGHKLLADFCKHDDQLSSSGVTDLDAKMT